jgi:hypothetical protein
MKSNLSARGLGAREVEVDGRATVDAALDAVSRTLVSEQKAKARPSLCH